MNTFKNISKSELIELINELERTLTLANQSASDEAHSHSEEARSQLAFEVGYLGGSIKSAISLIHSYKKM